MSNSDVAPAGDIIERKSMSDYGYYGSKRKHSKRGGGRADDKSGVGTLWIRVVDGIVLLLTIVLVVAFLLSFMARLISPEKMPLLAVAGLFYPFIYVANLICMLYWAVRWSRVFWLSLAVVMVGLGSVKLFYRPELVKQYAVEQDETDDEEQNGFVVMTYNVLGFFATEQEDRADVIEKIAEMANANSASVICFQEFRKTSSYLSRMEAALGDMRYSTFVNYDEGAVAADGGGLAIYSVFPIVNSGVVDMDTPRIYSMWADLKIGTDTVRVISSHLQSTHITQKDRNETITPRILGDTTAGEKMMTLSRKLADNYVLRAEQARRLHEFVAQSPYGVVVCGDFNDTAGSYAYRVIRRGLHDTFTEQGVGFVHTFRDFGNLLRIDYILVSDHFSVEEYDVPQVNYSDHLPVVSRIRLSSQDE